MSKTLHWYILRELLRMFLLTSSVLTTILAFGGTFRPLTKEGLTIVQLMHVLLDLMPAMLAYSIPLAALFAAVIVYWRLATDNELTGARASGVSYVTLVMPAMVLGLAVGFIDLVFVGYVVPRFLQKTSQVIQMDVASMLLHNVDQRQPFQFNNMVVYADRAYEVPIPANDLPPPGVLRTIIQLRGLAAMPLKNGQPTAIIIAKAANVIVDKDRAHNQVSVGVQLENGTAFDPNSLRQIRGTIRYLPPDGRPAAIGSLIQNRPKFLDLFRLEQLALHPLKFGPIAKNFQHLLHELQKQNIAAWYFHAFKPNQPLSFARTDGAIIVTSPAAMLSGTHKNLLLTAVQSVPVRVQVIHGGRVTQIYLARRGELLVSRRESIRRLSSTPQLTALLKLTGDIREKNIGLDRGFHTGPPMIVLASIHPVTPDSGIPPVPPLHQASPIVAQLIKTIHAQENHLDRQILSEFQSRGSFAFSCLVLVLLGTALGIILQGRNPLAVFVVGVVPAMILVLLINTGREMITRTTTSDVPGTILIWSGNGIIVLLNIVIYSRLLKR
ncbi:MAG: LptF/LptG family permease [Phycisphaerae bacterium]